MIPANGAPHDLEARDVHRSLPFAQRRVRENSKQIGASPNCRPSTTLTRSISLSAASRSPGEYVIARQAREILKDLILAHDARQIFENIGGCDPSARNAGLTAADSGSDVNILLPMQRVRHDGRPIV